MNSDGKIILVIACGLSSFIRSLKLGNTVPRSIFFAVPMTFSRRLLQLIPALLTLGLFSQPVGLS